MSKRNAPPKSALSALRRALRDLISGAHGTAGAALVEFTLFASLLLLPVAVYTIDFGLLYFNKMEVQNAAQAGAQYVIVNGNYSSSAIQSAVTNATSFGSIQVTSSQFCGCPSTAGVTNMCNTATSCSCNTSSCSARGVYVTVTATPTTSYATFIPYGVLTGSNDISSQVTVRIGN